MKNKDIKNMFLKEDEKLDIEMSQKLYDTPIQQKPAVKVAPKQKQITNKRWVFAPIVSFALIIVIALSLIFTNGTNSSGTVTAYVLDINPSISITTNSDNEVINICSLNDDADTILAEDCFNNIVGKSLDVAVENIISVAKEKGIFDEYQDTIQLWTLNDNPSRMRDKLDKFGDMVRRNLDDNNLQDINFEKHEMPLDDFRQRMGFEGEYQKLDDMKGDIQRHDKYRNPPPPNGNNPPPDDNPPPPPND